MSNDNPHWLKLRADLSPILTEPDYEKRRELADKFCAEVAARLLVLTDACAFVSSHDSCSVANAWRQQRVAAGALRGLGVRDVLGGDGDAP